MTIEITPQNVITAASLLTAVICIIALFAKGVRWFDKQDKQTVDIKALEEKHNSDVEAIKKELSEDMRAVNEEQTLLTYGILACLKGLREQGCNGPVTEAIDKIEKYLNKKAHEV